MFDYLLVSDAVSPFVDDEATAAAKGLARALVAAKHKVAVLSLAPEGAPARVPGLARRLRKVSASIGPATFTLPLFEGRASASDPALFLIELDSSLPHPLSPARRAALLGSGAQSLNADGLISARTVIGWGEGSATSLIRLHAQTDLFVLPTGRVGVPLEDGEAQELHLGVDGDEASTQSLASIGAVAAHAVILPSPSAARDVERRAGVAAAADEPLVALRFGCDEPPHDPATDTALLATYSAENPNGKATGRRLLGRKLSLAMGPRTLLVGVGPLLRGEAGAAVLEVIARSSRLDLTFAVAPGGDRELLDRARIVAIENPSRVALVADEPGWQRRLFGACDAWLLSDSDDLTGRRAHLALRYGTLPVAPALGAYGDYLVDYDPGSDTGNAVLFPGLADSDIEAALARAVALRADSTVWDRLVQTLFRSAPSWAHTAALIEALRASATEPEPPAAPEVPASAPLTASPPAR